MSRWARPWARCCLAPCQCHAWGTEWRRSRGPRSSAAAKAAAGRGAGAVREPSGQLDGFCSSVSRRRALDALWLQGPPFGKALPGNGPRWVVLRTDLSPRQRRRQRTGRCRAGQGTDKAPPRGPRGRARVTAGERPDPGLGPGSGIRADGGGGGQGCAGSWRGLCGSVRVCSGPCRSVRAGADRAARRRQGAITGRVGSGGGVPVPAPPRGSPVPLSRGDPVPPPAQRGPGPAGPRIDVLHLGPTLGLALHRGLRVGRLPPCPVRCPWGSRPGPRGHRNIHPRRAAPPCPGRSGSAAVAMGTNRFRSLSLPWKPVPVSPLPWLSVLRGFSSPLAPWGHGAVGHKPWTGFCGAVV